MLMFLLLWKYCNQVVGTKFLSVIIDQHLSWKSHISFVF